MMKKTRVVIGVTSALLATVGVILMAALVLWDSTLPKPAIDYLRILAQFTILMLVVAAIAFWKH